jgi:hypothetical protein
VHKGECALEIYSRASVPARGGDGGVEPGRSLARSDDDGACVCLPACVLGARNLCVAGCRGGRINWKTRAGACLELKGVCSQHSQTAHATRAPNPQLFYHLFAAAFIIFRFASCSRNSADLCFDFAPAGHCFKFYLLSRRGGCRFSLLNDRALSLLITLKVMNERAQTHYSNKSLLFDSKAGSLLFFVYLSNNLFDSYYRGLGSMRISAHHYSTESGNNFFNH